MGFLMHLYVSVDLHCISAPNNPTMSNREPTRWQHNRIYPQPISLCECMTVIMIVSRSNAS